MHEADVVTGGVLPDKNCMMRAEVVEDDDEPFIGVRSLIFSQNFPDVFLL